VSESYLLVRGRDLEDYELIRLQAESKARFIHLLGMRGTSHLSLTAVGNPLARMFVEQPGQVALEAFLGLVAQRLHRRVHRHHLDCLRNICSF
jgi:hypothetical protein